MNKLARWGWLALGLVASAVWAQDKAQLAPAPPSDLVYSPEQRAHRDQAVATYTGGEVTIGEMEDAIANQSPLIQQSALEPANLQALLERLLRAELFAAEAERRGYATRSEAVHAAKENAIALFIRYEVEAKQTLDMIPAEAVAQYEREHASDFEEPEHRRCTQIVVASEAQARALLPQARGIDAKAFAALVQQHSVDEPSKRRNGDLGYFDATGKGDMIGVSRDPAVVQATFALHGLGMISDVVPIAGGFAIVRLEGVQPRREVPAQQREYVARRKLNDQAIEAKAQAIVARQRELTPPVFHYELLDLIPPAPEPAETPQR